MATSFAAVDLGATSGRVMLGTFGAGFRLDEVHRFANAPITVDGVTCWDVERLFAETLAGLRRAVSRASDLGSRLDGIGVDAWGVDYGLVGDDLALVAPVRHYRASREEDLRLARVAVPADEAYARTGIVELPINTCFQLGRDARAGLLGQGVTALLIPDLWTAWLTGQVGAERTIASTTGLVDWRTRDWAHDLAARGGIPRRVLPELVDTGTVAGMTWPAVTAAIGADAPVTVRRAPGHDTASAFAAVTSPQDAAAVVSCGTWALAGCLSPAPVLTPAAAAAGFTNETAADGSALLVRNLSGTWLLDECIRAWADEDGRDDVAALRAEMLAASSGPQARVTGTIDVGAPELITTRDMPAALARLHRQVHGDDGDLDRPRLVRLVLESLATAFAETVDAVETLTGRRLDEVVLIGGGSRIAPLVEMTGRACGRPVVVSHQEASSIGNVCVQAVGAGLFEDLAAARRAVGDPAGGDGDQGDQ